MEQKKYKVQNFSGHDMGSLHSAINQYLQGANKIKPINISIAPFVNEHGVTYSINAMLLFEYE